MPWYLSGGIALANVVAAYQAKGAASLAASYVNLANPGTNDAALGVAPTFDTTTGWTFNGSSQYLISATPTNGYSIFAQYANWTLVNNSSVFGVFYDPAETGGYLVEYLAATGMRTYNGAATVFADNAPGLATGNYGFAGKTPYRNGVAEPNTIGAGTGTGHACHIGTFNYLGSPGNFYANVEVRAFVMYNVTITAPQVAALATAMAAL